MIQIIPRAKSHQDYLFDALGSAAEAGVNQMMNIQGKQTQKKQQEAERNFYKRLTGEELPEGISPELTKAVITEKLKSKGKEQLLQQKQEGFADIIGGRNQGASSFADQVNGQQGMGDEGQLPQGILKPEIYEQQGQKPKQQKQGQFNAKDITDEQIAKAEALDPRYGTLLHDLRQDARKQDVESEKLKQKNFESERTYHTGYSKDLEKNVDQMRLALPKKLSSLELARNAIESDDVGYLSWSKLADATGIDAFRTAKGAQLINAAKENLLSNMNTVSAKAQNIWFEQRMNSMFAKVGQSKEANLTMQEMLEGEAALDQAYINEFDRVANQDEKSYGFVKKDIGQRTDSALKPIHNEILKRTSYRLKEIEEQEKGLEKIQSEVGKKVVKGTPLTMAMAKLYHDKFGEKALDVAKKNGYTIPTLEEFRIYQVRPQEFREEL